MTIKVYEDDELEVIMHQFTLTVLQAIEHAITIRIHNVAEQIEAESNKSMDRFRRREVR